jgi:Right handed beta helix region
VISGFGIVVPALALFALACGGSDSDAVPALDSARARSVLPDLSRGRLPPPGARRYVSPRGSDTNPGTLRRPWRTVQHGLDQLEKGQALLLRGGTYRENLVMTRGGTSARPIIVQNYPHEHPILRPGDTDENNMPLQVGSGAAYLRFSGLVFEGARGPSTTNIYVWGSAHDVTFTQCESRWSARQGFFSEAMTRGIRISRCYFHDNGGAGPRNLDHNLYIEGRNHVIANNVITGAKNGYGIQLYPSSDRVVVANNTVALNRSGFVLGGEGSATTRNARVVNNIIAFNQEYGVTVDWGDSRGTGDVVADNVVFGNDENLDTSAGGVVWSSNLVRDPLFVDLSRQAFHLRAGSPAIDRALARYSPATDFDGRRRPQGVRSDLGAFERTVKNR